MADSLTSHLNIGDSIVSGPVPISPFTPGSGNVSPKFVDAINDTGYDTWYFDGVAEDHSAVVIGMNRSSSTRSFGGFKVQVLAIWPDQSTWHRDFYFPESIITITKNAGDIATLDFNVPSVVTGAMSLVTLPGDTGLNTGAELGPSSYCMRPIGRASVTAELTFDSSRKLSLKPQDGSIMSGCMERFWSESAWNQIFKESFYVHVQVGPYAMQILRIFSDVKSGAKPYTTARLYCDGRLICAAQKVISSEERQVLEDSVVLSKTYGNPDAPGLTGAFCDTNTGYTVEFIQGGIDVRRWRFDVRHERTLWSIPYSKPGPNAIGNTGFIESVTGGLDGESFHGVGVGGQLMLPSAQ